MLMYEFYYRYIAPIICRIFGHNWEDCGSIWSDYKIGVRRFNYGRKGGKRRPQIYRKSGKHTYKYCTRCGHLMTKAERRRQK